MRGAKYPLAVVVSLILIAVPICARICDLNCSFYGCSLSSSPSSAENPGEHAACHQHKPHKKAPEHKGSSQCAGHSDVTALQSSTANSTSAPPSVADASALISAPLSLFHPSPEKHVAQRGRKPDRSPPAHTVLRI
jgi:hypothetical protein